MPIHFIISVGTSVIGNFQKSNPPEKLRLSFVPGLGQRTEFDDSTFPSPDMICENYETAAPVLRNGKYEGAEQASIKKVMKFRNMKQDSDCYFHLLVTNTENCIFCASFLGHEFLPPDRVKYYIPPGLGRADEKKFAAIGLPNLLACVASILDQVEEKGEESILIPTGGFKIIIPYLTIASILYKKPAYYIYEESQTPLELPAPPLSVDVPAFRSVLVLLENIIGLNMKEAGPYYKAMPTGFQSLVYINENGQFAYTSFGERLKKTFTHQTGVSPVTLRISENSLIPYLDKNREKFIKMSRLGETVWMGDKAPEMADHARHHHTSLFAYTELLLLPILKHHPFLRPEELFLFLGMVYLHDCGHSLCTIPGSDRENIPLLPSEIRNFHNLLGFYRLHSPAFHSTLRRQGIEPDPDDLLNIAGVSVYHRKKMPLLSGSCTAPDGTVFGPVSQKQDMMHDGVNIPGNRLALLISLFRIVDGMDKQLGRAGDAVEITMKAEAVLSDLPYLRDRVKRMEMFMKQKGFKKAGQIADRFFEEIVEDYGLKEKAVSSSADMACLRKTCNGCHHPECITQTRSPGYFSEEPYFLKLRKELARKKMEACLPIAWEYLESRVKFFFHALQPSYYYTDLLLGMPRVSHRLGDGLRYITISYPENKDISGSQEKIRNIWKEIGLWIKQHLPEHALERKVLNAGLAEPEHVVCGIRDEYCSKKNSEVAQILRNAGIFIEFQYKGETVSCWK